MYRKALKEEAELAEKKNDIALEIYEAAQKFFNGGAHCPKPGSLGELAVLGPLPSRGTYHAVAYLWQNEYSDFTSIRELFKSKGATDITIMQTMDDEEDEIINGIDLHCGRQIIIYFDIAV